MLFGFMRLHMTESFLALMCTQAHCFLVLQNICKDLFIGLRCHLWLLHHPSTVWSKNQNFSLETLLSEVMCSLLFLAGQTQECMLAF